MAETVTVTITRKHTPTERNPLATVAEVREIEITTDADYRTALTIVKFFADAAAMLRRLYQK